MALTTDAARVEVAWTTTNPLSTSPVWEDMSSSTALEAGISWARGRSDENGQVSSGQFSFTLRNDDGAFTPGRSSSSRYPNVTIGKRARLTVRRAGVPGNLLSAENASFEGGTAGGWGGFGGCSVANSAVRAQDGTKSLLVTWATGGTGSNSALVNVTGLIIGRTYTVSMYVYVPVGSPTVAATAFFVATGATMSTTGAFTRCSVTFTAPATTQFVGLVNVGAATAGQQAWIDAVMVDEGSTVGTFTTAAPVINGRFDGVINSITPVFNEVGSFVVVTAADLLRNLGDVRPLMSMLSEEILLDAPLAYYPLGEPNGATTAGNVATSTYPPVLTSTARGAGGTISFGTGTGPGFDGLSAPVFTPVSTTVGNYLTGTATTILGADVASSAFNVTLSAFVNTSTAAAQVITRALDGIGGSYISLEVTAASKLLVNVFDAPSGTIVGTLTSASNVTGGTKHVAATVSVSGTTATINLYMDGSNVGTTTWAQASGLLYAWNIIRVGGGPSDACLTATVSHVALFPTALSSTRIAAHRNAGMTGFTGELSGTRAARILGYILPAGLISCEAGLSTIGPQSTSGSSALASVQAVADSERGLVFAAGDGRVTFHGRSHRYNASASITVNPEADLGSPEFPLPLSDQFLVNDVTVSRYQGAAFRATNPSSIAAYGTYSESLDVIVDSDNQAASIATNIANQNAVPLPRASDITVDMLTTPSGSQDALVLALDLGARIDVSPLPSIAPTTSVQMFVEGVSESISANSWVTKINTSPASTTSVWILGDSTYGVLGSTTRLAL